MRTAIETLLILLPLAVFELAMTSSHPTPATAPAHAAQITRSLSEQRDSIVAFEATRFGVPVAVALAVSHVENTRGDSAVVSTRGAVGIMQVLPHYWSRRFEPLCGRGSLVDRERNACVGVLVLAQYHAQLGSWDRALRAYNGALHKHTAGDVYVASVLEVLAVR